MPDFFTAVGQGTHLHPDGPPRDIIMKPHLYKVKEMVMQKSKEFFTLVILGYPIQIFADISPFTIKIRRTLKLLLLSFSSNIIKYRWAFPFHLLFSQHKLHLSLKVKSYSNGLAEAQTTYLSTFQKIRLSLQYAPRLPCPLWTHHFQCSFYVETLHFTCVMFMLWYLLLPMT